MIFYLWTTRTSWLQATETSLTILSATSPPTEPATIQRPPPSVATLGRLLPQRPRGSAVDLPRRAKPCMKMAQGRALQSLRPPRLRRPPSTQRLQKFNPSKVAPTIPLWTSLAPSTFKVSSSAHERSDNTT